MQHFLNVTGPEVRVIHISKNIAPRAMKFGQNMDVDDPKYDQEGHSLRSKVKATRSKTLF